MARTLAEKEASDELELAIDAFRKAYIAAHPDVTDGTLVDWIVVAAETKPNLNDPDDDVTAYSIIMPNGGIPWYRARGLMQAGIYYLDEPTEDG
jgi:hypothetical protein